MPECLPQGSFTAAVSKMTRCLGAMVLIAGMAEAAESTSVPNQNQSASDHPLVQQTKVQAGLAVHSGARDLAEAISLAKTGRFLVHVIPASPANVQDMLAEVSSNGLSGVVTVGPPRPDGRLPFRKDAVNLLLLDGDSIAKDEAARVAAPLGAIASRAGSSWTVENIPYPDSMAPWRHFYGEPTNNPASTDSDVKASTGLQWIGGPAAQRSEAQPGIRTDEGRLVSLWTYEPNRKTEVIQLFGRDAFSGVGLWSDKIMGDPRSPAIRYRKYFPYILSGDRVYTYLEPGSKPVAIDSTTGKVVKTFEEADAIPEKGIEPGLNEDLLATNGTLVQTSANRVTAVDLETGARLWSHEAGEKLAFANIFASEDGSTIFAPIITKTRSNSRIPGLGLKGISAFETKTGKEKWKSDFTGQYNMVMSAADDLFLFKTAAQSGEPSKAAWAVARIDDQTGQQVWKHQSEVGNEDGQLFHMAVFRDKLWFMGSDLVTMTLDGEKGPRFNMGNSRCTIAFPTQDMLVLDYGRYINPEDMTIQRAEISRSSCGSGSYPANGLVYVQPNRCACYRMVRGFLALNDDEPLPPLADDLRLVKGAAQAPAASAAASLESSGSQWPTILGNGRRNSWSDATGPTNPRILWQAKISDGATPADDAIRSDWQMSSIYTGPLTAPVIADGRVFVADRDTHTVQARSLSDGKELWKFVAGGRIDTPPSISNGLCIFGSRDGFIYCLRADTGELVWQFFAAAGLQNIVAYSQVESLWPVHGSVLVKEGLVFAASGYHPDADGGITVWALKPESGEVVWKRQVNRDRVWDPLGDKDQKGLREAFFTVPASGVSANAAGNSILFDSGPGIGFNGVILDMAGEPLGTFMRQNKQIRGSYQEAPADHEWIDFGMVDPFANTVYSDWMGPGLADKIHWWINRANGRQQAGVQIAWSPEETWATQITNQDGRALAKMSAEQAKPSKTTKLPSGPSTVAMAVAGPRVYLAVRNIGSDFLSPWTGELLVFDRATEKQVASVKLPDAPTENGIAVVDGRVVLTLKDGSLICLGDEA